MSRAKVQDCIRRARSESGFEEKLNAITDAINAFVDYVEQMEHPLRNVDAGPRQFSPFPRLQNRLQRDARPRRDLVAECHVGVPHLTGA